MINIRKEFKNIIEEDCEYHNIIVRHMSEIKCCCITQPPMIPNKQGTSTIPNPAYRNIADPECNNCGGSGYIYEEFLYKAMVFYPGFRFAHYEDTPFAFTEENVLTIYLKASIESLENTRVNDWIFFIEEDINGNIKKPIVRIKKWIIIDVQRLRLDSNKLEYVKLYAKPVIL
jgi:hypothetical protein